MPDQVGRQRWQPIEVVVRPTIFNCDVAAFDIADLAEPATETGGDVYIGGLGAAAEKADHRHPALLRPRRQRPSRRRAAEKRDEVAAFHGSLPPPAGPLQGQEAVLKLAVSPLPAGRPRSASTRR